MPLWRFYSHVVAPRPWLSPAPSGYLPPAGFGLRRKAVDVAALHTRQFSGSPQRPTMLRMAVEAGVAGIGLQARAKCQLCFPAVAIDGESSRLKEARERTEQRARQRRSAK